MTIDNTIIANLAANIHIQRDSEDRLLGFHDGYIAAFTNVELPLKRSEVNPENMHQMVGWTIKAEAALRVMLAKEIISAAAK